MPLVSVVIPTHNRVDLLGQTLDSVRSQSFEDFECLVIDDASTDGTADFVQAYAARDPRFGYVRHNGRSAASSRNRGLALANGKYVGFLDDDDLFEPDKLAWQTTALENDPGAVLSYGEAFIFHNGEPSNGSLYGREVPVKPTTFETLLTFSAIYAPLVRTDAMRAAGGFDETLPSAEDWDGYLAVARQGHLIFEPRIAIRYRKHAGNKSGRLLRNFTCGRKVAAKHLKHVPLPRRLKLAHEVRAYFRRVYYEGLYTEANRLTNAGEWAAAREYWRALAWLDRQALLRKHVLINTTWSLMPTQSAPPWRRRPPAATA